MNRLLCAGAVSACLVWGLGFFAEDLSRVLLGGVVVLGVVVSRRRGPAPPQGWATAAFAGLLIALPLVSFAHGWSRVLAGRMGVDFALLLVQATAFSASLAGLVAAGRKLGLGPLLSLAWALIVGLSPNVRPELLWGVHDEVLAVPLVIWAFVALLGDARAAVADAVREVSLSWRGAGSRSARETPRRPPPSCAGAW